MMTDPVADMLTRIRNAVRVKHGKTGIPHSRFKEGVAKVLQEEGYIETYKVLVDEAKPCRKNLFVFFKYGANNESPINAIERISRPGKRVFRDTDSFEKVLDGLGITILSTSKGIMSHRKAKKENIGGEVLCRVW
ncbi:MAG: 30S ribosomal protein S8 [Planctomycetes bacterium RBG_16_59_8]|nr:MAG: 30S ribosomal protein S8 [Planctomycetes bacterium RBG_16_59_8]